MKAPFKRGTRLIDVHSNAKCKYVAWWGMQRASCIVVKYDTGAEQTVHVNDVRVDPNPGV